MTMNVSDFCLACCQGDLEAVRSHCNQNNINEVGLIVEEKDENGWILFEYRQVTPLLCAIENNHLPIVKYLFEHGADIYQLGFVVCLQKKTLFCSNCLYM
jgi:ankyrin repeat protein